MKLYDTCKFNPSKYNRKDFVCEHPVLFYEEVDFKGCGKVYECPICGRNFDATRQQVSDSALKNRFLLRTYGYSTKHYYYVILVMIRKIAFTYSTHKEIDLAKILKQMQPEIEEYLEITNPNTQYKNLIEDKIKKIGSID